MTEDKAQPHGAYILFLGSAWSFYLPIISFCAQITKATAGKVTCVVGWLFVPLHRAHSMGPMLSDKGSKYLPTLIIKARHLL